ncbi:MAG TPA: nuclear transport factor 2 family protein [Actinophytocola sp.]|jgi:ketosteroid isomerase-like protein|uniref:nuclear transport factor 2 family protein n=1 Tax=Actinophytocola sp. TaxID=1872138 RepID=UPI002F92DDFC
MTATPREVAHRLVEGISEQRWAELPDLYAEDTVVEQPFNPRPAVLRGRGDLAAHFAAAADRPLRVKAKNVVVHETTDPEVVVMEYDYDVDAQGRTGTVGNVLVLRVRDGRIVSSRDYHDHGAIAAIVAG